MLQWLCGDPAITWGEFLTALFLTLIVVLPIMYIVKSALGIDLVPGMHAWEVLGL